MKFVLNISPIHLQSKQIYFEKYQNEFISLSEKSIFSAIKRIFYGKYDFIVFHLIDNNTYVYKSLLFTLSIFNWRKKTYYLNTDNKLIKIHLFDKLYSIFKIFFASLSNYHIFILTKIKMKNRRKAIRYTQLNTKSKIIYINSRLMLGEKIGGSFSHIKGVAEALAIQSELTYIDNGAFSHLNNQINRITFPIEKLIFSIPKNLNELKLSHYLMDFIDFHLEVQNYDFIYHRLSYMHPLSAFLSIRYNIPLIVEYNSSPTWTKKNWSKKKSRYDNFSKKIEKFILDTADYIVTISDVNKMTLINEGFSAHKIFAHPNGVNPNKFPILSKNGEKYQKTRIKLNLTMTAQVFTFIGTFGPWHGVEFLANCIIDLSKNHRNFLISNEIKFLLIGNGRYYDKVKSIISKNNCDYFVRFTGYVQQDLAPDYLAISDVFLSPHIKEKDVDFFGSPTKIFEYMSLGKPIIASDLGQIGQVFNKGIKISNIDNIEKFPEANAVLFQPNNKQEFIKAVKLVINNKQFMEKLGKNARMTLLKDYTWSKVVTRLIGFINSKVDELKL